LEGQRAPFRHLLMHRHAQPHDYREPH
jgi:hypothetical protein